MASGEDIIVCRNFQITLISATELEDVRKLFRMKVYAEVSIGDDAKTEKRTKADKQGETNPRWSCTMQYTIGEQAVIHHGLMLVIKLKCKRKLGDRDIGEVHRPIKSLFDNASQYDADQFGVRSGELTCPVQKGSDEDSQPRGMLRFSYRFGERKTIKRPPIWKKWLSIGVVTLLQVALISTIGVYLPPIVEIPIFNDPHVIE